MSAVAPFFDIASMRLADVPRLHLLECDNKLIALQYVPGAYLEFFIKYAPYHMQVVISILHKYFEVRFSRGNMRYRIVGNLCDNNTQSDNARAISLYALDYLEYFEQTYENINVANEVGVFSNFIYANMPQWNLQFI